MPTNSRVRSECGPLRRLMRLPCTPTRAPSGSGRAGRASSAAARHGRRRCACRRGTRFPTRARAAAHATSRWPGGRARNASRSNSMPVSSTGLAGDGRPSCPTGPARRRRAPSRSLGSLRLGAPQDGMHAGDELARRERLRHVVVGAQLEPGDAVDLLVPRRHDHDRQARALPGSSGRGRGRPRPGSWRSRIARRMSCCSSASGAVGAPGGPDHPEAVVLEIGADERRDVLLVLDEEDRAAPRCSDAHAPGRLRTLTTCAGPSGAWVTSTDAPGARRRAARRPR